MAERKLKWRGAGDLLIAILKVVTDFELIYLEGKKNWFGNFINA
jgi:hypothetical protein